MDTWLKVLIGVLVAFLVGFPLLGKLASEDREAAEAQSAEQATPTPKKTPAPPPKPAPKKTKPGKPAAQVQTSGLNAQTIVGTQWLIDGKYEVTFLKGGKVSVAGAIPGIPVSGTWRIDGNTLTASAMGQNISLKLDGDTVRIDGATVERLR